MKTAVDFRSRLRTQGENLSREGHFLPVVRRVANDGRQKNFNFIGVFTETKIIFNVAQPLLKEVCNEMR